jgi:hypothetical protein
MTWQTVDRVKETTTSTGTGLITLAGAMTGFRSFASVCATGDSFYYGVAAVDSNGNPTGVWEIGVGTYGTFGANSLNRVAVLASSNGGSLVTLPTGTAQVWMDMPAVALAALQSSQYSDGGGFVDGNFDFWDTAPGVVNGATDVYITDMWIGNAGTGGQWSVTQTARTLGSEPAYMTRPSKYILGLTQNNTPTTSPTIGQKLEGVGQYNGQTITISVSANTVGTHSLAIGAKITQHFGSGGSPSSDVVLTVSATWSLNATEQKYSVVINVPSISGKTIGTTAGTDYLRVDLTFPLAPFAINLSQMQIDVCNPNVNVTGQGNDGIPLPFRYRGLGPEMQRVQRYVNYVNFPSSGVLATAALVSATTSVCGVAIPMMRAIPSCSIAGTLSLVFPSSTSSSVSAAAVQNTFVRVIGVHSGATAGQAGYLSGTGTAGSIIADARL